MFSYALACVGARPSLWLLALPCALLAALPLAVAVTVFAPSGVALALMGDVRLAGDLLPSAFGGEGARVPAATWFGAAIALIAGVALWSRLFAGAVWTSDDSNDAGVRIALGATTRRWRRVLVLYLEAGAAIALAAATLLWPVVVVGGGSLLTSLTLGALAAVVAFRTLVRILLTLAVRAAILGDQPPHRAWREARSLMADRRRDVAAAWMFLVAIGLAVWVGGRFLLPVLQDTALDYPSSSNYTLGLQAAQLLVSVPLEAGLMAAAFGVWTALYLDKAEVVRTPPPSGRRRGSDPLMLRALITLFIVALVGNGIPTAIESAYARRQAGRFEDIERREIDPTQASSRPQSVPGGRPPSTRYTVEAGLTGAELTWTTLIDYSNATGEPLKDLGVHVYPAAYAEPVAAIPFGEELLAADLDGSFRAEAEPGTFDIGAVRVNGGDVRWSRSGTALVIELEEPLAPGDRALVRIDLIAGLPHWPERFGVWDDTILLGNWIPTIAVRQHGSWRLDQFSGVGDPFFSEVADYSVTITVDREMTVVGSGTLVSARRGRWSFDARSSRDAAFALAPFMRGLETRVGRTTVRSWYMADERAAGAANFDAALSAVKDYTGRFGALPMDEIELVVTRGSLGGMEYPGLIFTSGSNGPEAGFPLIPDLVRHVGFDVARRRYIVGHEVAHQWWYAAVGNDQVREPWLDESFAEVSTRLWLRAADGDNRAWRITTGSSTAEPRPGVLSAAATDFSSNARYSDAVYSSGAAVLLDLRERIGARKFTTVMRRWYERNYLAIGTVGEFVSLVEDVAGPQWGRYLRRFIAP
ncbi:MAG: M1 family metallopeptidase [Actinobacteria bacterium]|nr:M1 family metallopeptidase [Actinomycetota bacterium]